MKTPSVLQWMWRKVPPRFSHEKSDYCPAKIKKLHNPPTPLTPANTQTISMMTVHSSRYESGSPTVQINTVSHGVSSTCWASRMFLSSVSGRCVHCAEEWSNYGSPVHTQHKINEFTFHSAILSTDDTEKEQNASQWRAHLLSPPPPLSQLLRLLHLDQDVLLVGEVDHPSCERPPHLELQQSVVAKICQVHGCGTRTVKEKYADILNVCSCGWTGRRSFSFLQHEYVTSWTVQVLHFSQFQNIMKKTRSSPLELKFTLKHNSRDHLFTCQVCYHSRWPASYLLLQHLLWLKQNEDLFGLKTNCCFSSLMSLHALKLKVRHFHLSSCWLMVRYAYIKYRCAATSMKKIQKLSVEETASILQGLSRSGYMLKNSWNHQNTDVNILFTQSKLFVPKISKYGEKKNQSNVWNSLWVWPTECVSAFSQVRPVYRVIPIKWVQHFGKLILLCVQLQRKSQEAISLASIKIEIRRKQLTWLSNS